MKTKVPYLDTRGKRAIPRVKTYVRRKQRGHTHNLYETHNTKGDIIEKCTVCKYIKIKYVLL